MSNMLSVVSTLSAEVLFPAAGLNTMFSWLVRQHTQDLENNSAKGRADPGEGALSAQGFPFPLKQATFSRNHFSHSDPAAISTAQPSTHLR